MKRVITFVTLVVVCAVAGALGGITTSNASWFQVPEPVEVSADDASVMYLPDYKLVHLEIIAPNRRGDGWRVYNGSTYELKSVLMRVSDFDTEESRRNGVPTNWRNYEMLVVGDGRPRSDVTVDGPDSVWGATRHYEIVQAQGRRTELTDKNEKVAEDLAEQMLENMTPPVYESDAPGPT